MFGQQNKLKEFFEQNGWELVETRKFDDIAVIQMWLIKSTWSPRDCFVFLSFETDPQDWYLQRKGEKPRVARVVATLKKPLDWLAESASEFEKNDVFEDKAYLYFGGSAEKKIPDLGKDLAEMRQKFYNFYN